MLGPDPEWYPPGPGAEPLPDTLLINGMNTFNCSVSPGLLPQNETTQNCTGGDLYNLRVESRKSYRLRLINPGSYAGLWFTIDGHNITIIEADGVEMQPKTVPGVFINIGQRYSVLVAMTESVGNYYIRASMQRKCFFVAEEYHNPALDSINWEAHAILSYDDTAVTVAALGSSGNLTNPYNGTCGDMPPDDLVPAVAVSPGDVPAENMKYITFGFYQAQQVQRIMINQTAYYPYANTTTTDVAMAQNWTPQNPYNFSASNLVSPLFVACSSPRLFQYPPHRMHSLS
jgi:Multicopper oxidase